MGLEAKKREVTQLLKDYRAWHTAYGGAAELNLESMGQYGPAGMIEEGMAFESRRQRMLAETYGLLEYALILLKKDDLSAWISLIEPYLGDPADPSVVDDWRKKTEQGYISAALFIERHDRAIVKLAEYLKGHDLYVAWPKRMSTRQEEQVDRMNDEFFALYQRYHYEDKMSRNKAIETAAEHCGYSRSRAYEIANLREGKAS